MIEPFAYDKLFWPTITISLKDIPFNEEDEYIEKIKKQFVRYFDFDFDDLKDIFYKENEKFVIQLTHGIERKSVDKMIKKASRFHEERKKHFIYQTSYHLDLDFLNTDVVFKDNNKNPINIGTLRENKMEKKMEKEKKYTDVTLENNVKINENIILHKDTNIRVYEATPFQGTFGFEGDPDWVENIYLPEMASEERIEKTLEMLKQEAEWITDYVENNDDYVNQYVHLPIEENFSGAEIDEDFEKKYFAPFIQTGNYIKEDILEVLWNRGTIEAKYISGYGSPFGYVVIFSSYEIGDYETQFGEELQRMLKSLSPEEYKEVQANSDIYLSDDSGWSQDRELGYLNMQGNIFFYIEEGEAKKVMENFAKEKNITLMK